MTTPQPVVLASESPRRAQLLAQIRIEFSTVSAAIDESVLPGEAAEIYVVRMARGKAVACARSGQLTLAADTIVVCDSQILGKPRDADDGAAMLRKLSGRVHDVMTAVAASDSIRVESVVVVSRVEFVEISPAQAAAYWATGEGADKAGGYGIQGIGGIFVKKLEGSYSAVVGLPLMETERLLMSFDIDTWRSRAVEKVVE